MKEKIKISKDHPIYKVKGSMYLSIELVDGIERAIIRKKPNFSAEEIKRIIENHRPRFDFSRLPTDERMTIVSPAKSYHLMKDNFLPWINPFDLNPFPPEGIEIGTDIIGKIYYISLASNANLDPEIENKQFADEESDLPF